MCLSSIVARVRAPQTARHPCSLGIFRFPLGIGLPASDCQVAVESVSMHRRRLRLSLTQQVALLSLIPMVALGFLLARVLESQIVTRTLADEDESAQLIAHLAIQPHLSPQDLKKGLSPQGVKALDEQLSGRSVTKDLARI